MGDSEKNSLQERVYVWKIGKRIRREPFIEAKFVTGESIDDAQWWFLDMRQNAATGNNSKITRDLPDA